MFPLFGCDAVHFLRQRERIDSVKKIEQWQGFPDFIFLELSYEMPAQVRWQLWNFRASFRDPALAEKCLAGLDCLAYLLGWVRFRDRHEFNFISRAISFCGCFRDSVANALKFFGNAHQLRL